jgi:hypothetical protein
MKSGTGKVNGNVVPSSGIKFTVKNLDVVSIEGTSGSVTLITNLGASVVHADCDLAAVYLGSPKPNSFLSFDFTPNIPKSIPNPLGSSISLKCTISSTDSSDVMFGVMKSGVGKVNGIIVPAAGISFTVKNGDVVAIEGDAGSEVSITNKGNTNVHADCDFALAKTKQIDDENSLLDTFNKIIKAANDLGSLDFAPNVPQSITNPLFWSISANCKITTIDASDSMSGKMASGSGTLNGQTIPDAGLKLTVKTGDTMAITATAYAAVTITNLGTSNVHADCSLGIYEKLKDLIKGHKKNEKKGNRIMKLLFKFKME